MRREITVLLVGALLGSVAIAKPNPKAQRLAVQGKKLLDSTDEPWRRFWSKPEAFPETELKELAKTFGAAVDALNASLDLEERAGLVKVIMLITRKQRTVIFEQMRRAKKARDASKKAKAKPKPKPEPKPKPKPKGSAGDEGEEPRGGDDDLPDGGDDLNGDDGGIEGCDSDEEDDRSER